MVFLSTPSARRATCQLLFGALHPEISIHALREEGDGRRHPEPAAFRHFYPRPPRGGRPVRASAYPDYIVISIHALREEGDAAPDSACPTDFGFLSTPSARRATGEHIAAHEPAFHFYPRPPRGGRPRYPYLTPHQSSISIHALREEGDQGTSAFLGSLVEFLSTPSARRATPASRSPCPARKYFYPRPPRGGRPDRTTEAERGRNFYPRPPRGGRPA